MLRHGVYLLVVQQDDSVLRAVASQYSGLFDHDIIITDDLVEPVQRFFDDKGCHETFSGKTFIDFVDWCKSQNKIHELCAWKRTSMTLKKRVDKELEKILMQTLLRTMPEKHEDTEGLEALVNDTSIENFSQAIEQITQFFTSKIRYLGPLRADPQASQKLSPSSELDDVGAKGEYAAAVYDANQDARIDWYNPYLSGLNEVH